MINRRERLEYWKSLKILVIYVLGGLWMIEIVDQAVFKGGLDGFGTRPGDFSHWEGIFLAPLLHVGFEHLIGNSIGLVLLGGTLMLRGWAVFAMVSLAAAIVAGIGILIFGEEGSIHVGASGVIYGQFGFLVAVGFYEKKLGSIFTSLFTILLHGSMIYGVFPGEEGVSWLGHLFGFLGGIAAAEKMRYQRHSPRPGLWVIAQGERSVCEARGLITVEEFGKES